MSVPAARDTTSYVGGNQPTDYRFPLFSSIDVEEGYVFTSYAFGFHVWDATGSKADDPQLKATRDQGRAEFLENIGYQEQRWLLWDIDAPPGDSDYVALAGIKPFGVSIWNTADKSSPTILYQDTGRSTHQVFSTTLGGRHYAFGASSGTGPGIAIYDMTAAKERYASSGGPCQENTASGSVCGIYKGNVTTSAFTYIDGFTTASGRTFIAASGGPGDGFSLGGSGIRLWEVTNPSNPKDLGLMFSGQFMDGVAVWEQGGRQFIGFQHHENSARIHEITNCLSGGCANPPQIWSSTWPSNLLPSIRWVTYSKAANGTGYLYFGTESLCPDATQAEWLFDLSTLTTTGPKDITPQATIPDPLLPGKQIGYWSHYYGSRSTGFNRVHPRAGKFSGNHFYRAAWTLFDVHKLVDVDPTITISGPTTGYAGTAANFTASASNCSPSPNGWTWSASGATGAGSSGTASLLWTSPGSKSVTATNSACPNATVVGSTIQILDPAPQVASISKSPASPTVCQPITLTANGVSGKPPLAYSWNVKNGSGNTVVTGGNVNPFVWDTSNPLAAAGTYTATVTVSGEGSAATETSVVLNGLTPLPQSGAFAPTNDSFTAGTVQFHVNVPGATAWSWDFGDGNGYTGWTTDPVSGPNPVKSYTSIGVKNVKVQVRNCQEFAGVESSVLQVNILQTTPLVASFAAVSQCQVAPCTLAFDVAEAIAFTDSSTGAELYDYDWNGDGTFEDANHTSPVTSHAYSSPGQFAPKLRVRRGGNEANTYTHGTITIEPAVPASISVSGPTSGNVGQALSFSASASNCSASSSSGWTWSATGASVSDSDNQVTVTFTSPGNKTVTARHSACGNAQGTRNVSVSGGGGGGGAGGGGGGGNQFAAAFTFSPTTPKAGEPVSFDGSGSTGPNLGYYWDFGDESSDSGKTPSHTFAEAKTYVVKLTVRESTCLSAGCPSNTTSKSVTVAPSGPTVKATFNTSASCVSQFGVNSCTAATGEEVTFSGTSTGATVHAWDFDDGTTASGPSVAHAWTEPGTYHLAYTASNGQVSDTVTRTFVISGAPVAQSQPVVVPWIAQTAADKALHQTSDLDVFNPGDDPLKVRLTFRKRGLPEPDPPQVERTIAAGATLRVPDAMTTLFDRENISGFLFVEPVEGEGQPVVTSFNRTFTESGQTYGQVVPGFPLGNLRQAADGPNVYHLVGLNDNGERQAYFGISNPNEDRLSYTLRFYDSLGRLVGGTTEPQGISKNGQRQYQVEEIRNDFGVLDAEDYRIEIEVAEGSPAPFVYGANLRLVSRDPSFLRVGRTDLDEVFLVGVLNTSGLNGSFFQSDVVLSNPGGSAASCDLAFTPVGFKSEPTAAFSEAVPAGQSVRLRNVVSEWNVGETVGVLRIACSGAGGVLPVVQGEGYDVSRPSEVYGQFMPALSLEDAAEPGKPHSLVGLQQDAENRTTLWLYNPTDEVTRYNLRYLDLDGNELGSETDVVLGRGKFRQVNPSHHPAGIDGGFVVRVEPTVGKVLTAAQVVNVANDPAYIVGQ